MAYIIRYLKIPPGMINNVLAPTETMIAERPEWFARLEHSILHEGIRNPVILTARISDGQIDIRPRYGGCRVWVAQRHNIRLPAIVADFDEVFGDIPAITQSRTEIIRYFRDPPRHIYFKPQGINVSGCPDVHMAKRNYHPNTQIATGDIPASSTHS